METKDVPENQLSCLFGRGKLRKGNEVTILLKQSTTVNIGAEVCRNKQTVRGTGTRTRLVLSGSPHPLLYLPSDRGNETGGGDNGGGLNHFIRTLRKLPGKCIWFNVTRPWSIGQCEVEPVKEQ